MSTLPSGIGLRHLSKTIGSSDSGLACEVFKPFNLQMRFCQVSSYREHHSAPILIPKVAFDWETLPKDSVVVDVGGGVGAASMPLARKYDHFKLVVQDRPPVVEEGKKVPKASRCFLYWLTRALQIYFEELPEALQSGRVQFQGNVQLLNRE